MFLHFHRRFGDVVGQVNYSTDYDTYFPTPNPIGVGTGQGAYHSGEAVSVLDTVNTTTNAKYDKGALSDYWVFDRWTNVQNLTPAPTTANPATFAMSDKDVSLKATHKWKES
jgi:hypothetical protein